MARAIAPARVAVVAGCLSLGARLAGAQTSVGAELGAGAAHLTLNGYLPASVTTFSALIRGSATRLHGEAGVDVSRFETSHVTSYRSASAILDLPTGLAWRGSWYADGGTGSFRGSASGSYVRTGVRVVANHGWALLNIGRAKDVRGYATKRAEAGLSATRGNFMFAVSADAAGAGTSAYGDGVVRAAWNTQRVRLEGNTGVRFGEQFGGARQWGTWTAAVALSRFISITGTAGTEPTDPERAELGARFVAAAMRFVIQKRSTIDTRENPSTKYSSEQSVFRVGALQADGTRTIVVRLDGARQVELMGDFTAWESRPMTRLSNGTWIIRLAVAPGPHRLNIRIDSGQWEVPPGVPSLPDDFGGAAGVIAVQ